MVYSFKVKFDTAVIIKNKACEVSQLSVGGVSIGYVHIDYKDIDAAGRPTVTTFNSLGLLQEFDCLVCAATALFSGFTKLPRESIQFSPGGINAHAIVTGLLLAEILKPSLKH